MVGNLPVERTMNTKETLIKKKKKRIPKKCINKINK